MFQVYKQVAHTQDDPLMGRVFQIKQTSELTEHPHCIYKLIFNTNYQNPLAPRLLSKTLKLQLPL